MFDIVIMDPILVVTLGLVLLLLLFILIIRKPRLMIPSVFTKHTNDIYKARIIDAQSWAANPYWVNPTPATNTVPILNNMTFNLHAMLLGPNSQINPPGTNVWIKVDPADDTMKTALMKLTLYNGTDQNTVNWAASLWDWQAAGYFPDPTTHMCPDANHTVVPPGTAPPGTIYGGCPSPDTWNANVKYFAGINIGFGTPADYSAITYQPVGYPQRLHIDGSYLRLAPALASEMGSPFRLGTNWLANPSSPLDVPQLKQLDITHIENNMVELVALYDNQLATRVVKIKVADVNAKTLKLDVEQHVILRTNYDVSNGIVSFGPAASSMYWLGPNNSMQLPYAFDSSHFLTEDASGKVDIYKINNPWLNADLTLPSRTNNELNPGMWNAPNQMILKHGPIKRYGLLKLDRNTNDYIGYGQPPQYPWLNIYTWRPSLSFENICIKQHHRGLQTSALFQIMGSMNEYQDNVVSGVFITDKLKAKETFDMTFQIFASVDEQISTNDVRLGCCSQVGGSLYDYVSGCGINHECSIVYPAMQLYNSFASSDISSGTVYNFNMPNTTIENCQKYCAELGEGCSGIIADSSTDITGHTITCTLISGNITTKPGPANWTIYSKR